MCGDYSMSKTKVKQKVLDRSSKCGASGWILLAENAERDAAKAQERSKQLIEAARIFRKNAESGMQFPQSASHESREQHSV
jgi:hypothetical protein